MKQIVKVSIASFSFGLEADAYQKLNAYLERLDRCYRRNADRVEIISDIEARIAELILSEQSIEAPVSQEMIEGIIARLGEPTEDVVLDDEHTESVALPKRLYRSGQGRRIGGVCAGLGAYFDTDPVWFRVAIFLPVILLIITAPLGIGSLSGMLGTLFGSIFLGYFILWLGVPMAKTPRQILEMKGEKITVSSIERNLKDNYRHNPKASRAAGNVADLLSVIVQVVLFIIKAFVIIVGFVIALSVIIIFMAIIALLVGVTHIGTSDITSCLPLEGVSIATFVALILAVIVLPMIMAGVVIIKTLFNRVRTKGLLSILLGIWIIVVVFTTVVSIRNAEVLKSNIDILNHTSSITLTKNINCARSTSKIVERDSTHNYKIIDLTTQRRCK